MFLGFPSVLYLYVCAGHLKLKPPPHLTVIHLGTWWEIQMFVVKRESQSS